MLNDKEVNQLVELNEELENYFKNTIIPQIFVDANFILRKFTPPAMRQFDLSASDIGKHFDSVFDNTRFPTILQNIEQVIESNEVLEKEIQTTDLRWFQMNILPYIIQETKKSNGVIITFIDITSRIRDLNYQEKLLADHEILLDTIAHDIRNPLTNLGLAVELFKSISLNNVEEIRSVLGTVERSIVKMKDIINDLTDTRRREHRYESEKELINIEHILEDVRLTLADNIKSTNARIFTDIHVSEILYSRRNLRSIVYNLISNAIKYHYPGRPPEITVTTKLEKEFVVICVSDNGKGITEENLSTIFDKYYRVDDTVEGTGVGLYLVKEMVTASGGKIKVESEVSKGSTFLVYVNPSLP